MNAIDVDHLGIRGRRIHQPPFGRKFAPKHSIRAWHHGRRAAVVDNQIPEPGRGPFAVFGLQEKIGRLRYNLGQFGRCLCSERALQVTVARGD